MPARRIRRWGVSAVAQEAQGGIDKPSAASAVTPARAEELLAQNPVFCLAPWTHLHALAEGYVTPCCESRQQLGNINKQSFQEIWNGAAMADVRAKMLRGEPVAACSKCYDKEAHGVESLRDKFNRGRSHHFDKVVGTTPDGRAPNALPIFWDIRFSNLCNFRCRSCWHGSSSRWFSDAVAMGSALGDHAIIHGVEDADALFEQLDAYLPALEEIYFAGGEPLITEEHYRLLDLLIARGACHVTLDYNTNLSVTGIKGHDVIEKWKRFPTIRVRASIDGVGARGELLRKEQNWQETVANAQRIRSECPHVNFRTEATVSVFNVLHLPTLVRELDALNVVPVDRMLSHLLQDPHHYNIRVLPRAMKARVHAVYAEFERWLVERTSTLPDGDAVLDHHRTQLHEILAYMDSEDWTHLLPSFRRVTAKLDALREEKTGDVFPELAPLIEGRGERWRAAMRFGRQKSRALLRRIGA